MLELTFIIGVNAITLVYGRVRQSNVYKRFNIDMNTWPPKQPKHFSPLLLIYYKGDRTSEKVEAMAELMYTGDIGKIASESNEQFVSKRPKMDNFQEIFNTSTSTTELKSILTPLENSTEPCFILVEGAPGIGKTVLLKEMAYRWGKEELLQKFELVLLLCLRDPIVQQIQYIDDLLHLYCKRDKNATAAVTACAEYLFDNGGKSVTFLLDGYDEYPEHLQKNSLIADILNRDVLPLCGLVLSSRPHASKYFHEQATVRVDILGFSETARINYIEQELSDEPHKIKQLTQYLYQHPSISGICFIPFNMVILLYLYEKKFPLPKNATELYENFICITICRHLSKSGEAFENNKINLSNLPEPYNKIIQQLSKLSLEGLDKNKLTFTVDEMKVMCPDLVAPSGDINGFGLLQAVQQFGLHAKTITFNFYTLQYKSFWQHIILPPFHHMMN